ncbi:HIT family protein [bacterium]|nr:HIT family protein [bacterium]
MSINLEQCPFCQIAQNQAHSYTIWEDENYQAFLSIYPNTAGTTIVIPKEHLSSDVLSLTTDEIGSFMVAIKAVSEILKEKLNDVGRVGLIFDGFGVNHAHAKLYPMHGTKMSSWKPIRSHLDTYFTQYVGYISSHDYHGVSDDTLAKIHQQLTN